MKNNFILLGLLTVFLVLGSCSKDALNIDEAAKLDDKKSKLQNREFVSESLTPNYIGNSEYRQMQIYTPPGYDKHSSKTYPVFPVPGFTENKVLYRNVRQVHVYFVGYG